MILSSNSLLFINNLLLSLIIYLDSLNPNILPSTTFNADTSYAWHPEYRKAGFLSNLHPVAVKIEVEFKSMKSRYYFFNRKIKTYSSIYICTIPWAPMGSMQLGVNAHFIHGIIKSSRTFLVLYINKPCISTMCWKR